ncbi:hypothetical protein F8388_001987 [Cannabis sativa]|uniref:Uncharacterized protein n=1 Tax=Cannabis sativa TaxID=3483 RepID=A0A7J6FNN4_CANSA|nr:hypothetical protein F8388_001987 [Cannabis sativa]KAF4398625.1 hypothetical protein G4B88_013714 [Cannabis sativa]
MKVNMESQSFSIHYWRDVSIEELIGGEIILIKFGTDIGISQTRPNFSPIGGAGDSVPEPIGEAVEAVFFVITTGDLVAAVAARDDKGEDEENEEESYEDGHTEEVKGEETLLVPASADEAGEGDEEDEDAEDNHRPPEGVDALVVGLGCKPCTGCDYGYGTEKGDEVEYSGYVVAHSHGRRREKKVKRVVGNGGEW